MTERKPDEVLKGKTVGIIESFSMGAQFTAFLSGYYRMKTVLYEEVPCDLDDQVGDGQDEINSLLIHIMERVNKQIINREIDIVRRVLGKYSNVILLTSSYQGRDIQRGIESLVKLGARKVELNNEWDKVIFDTVNALQMLLSTGDNPLRDTRVLIYEDDRFRPLLSEQINRNGGFPVVTREFPLDLPTILRNGVSGAIVHLPTCNPGLTAAKREEALLSSVSCRGLIVSEGDSVSRASRASIDRLRSSGLTVLRRSEEGYPEKAVLLLRNLFESNPLI